MKRSAKTFLASVFAWLFGLVIGFYSVGSAVQISSTSSGIVDMTDASQVRRALDDPTFITTWNWGFITLTGEHWAISIPLIFSSICLALVIVLASALKRSWKNQSEN